MRLHDTKRREREALAEKMKDWERKNKVTVVPVGATAEQRKKQKEKQKDSSVRKAAMQKLADWISEQPEGQSVSDLMRKSGRSSYILREAAKICGYEIKSTPMLRDRLKGLDTESMTVQEIAEELCAKISSVRAALNANKIPYILER